MFGELLADKLSNLFMRKTTTIRNNVIIDSPNNTSNSIVDSNIIFNMEMFAMSRSAFGFEVKEIITNSPNKSRNVDPLANWPLKKYLINTCH